MLDDPFISDSSINTEDAKTSTKSFSCIKRNNCELSEQNKQKIMSERKRNISKILNEKRLSNYKHIEKPSIYVRVNDDRFCNEFAGEIKFLYENKPEELQYLLNSDYRNIVSYCPICNNPALAFSDKVFCLNNCFLWDIKTCVFNNDFTVSHLMLQYKECLENHKDCHSLIRPIYSTEKFVYLNCEGCEKMDDEIIMREINS